MYEICLCSVVVDSVHYVKTPGVTLRQGLVRLKQLISKIL